MLNNLITLQMKRALLYRTIIAFLMLPIMVLASNDKDKGGKYTKEKTYHEEFSVNADAMLKIDNSYGNLDIVTWNENRIVIDITITTNGNNEEKVQKKLDGISVEFESNSNLVSAETIFNKKSSWWNWNSSSNVNMTINYVIKMPITNQVDLDNDYGNINLDKLEGRANISCDYGKVTTKELLADNNTINFDYTQKSYFEFIKSGKINADYSGFTVAKANALEIHSDYSNSVVEIVEDISYNCDYGTIKIEKVNNVSGNGDYLTTVLGDVYKTVLIMLTVQELKSVLN